MSIPIRTVTVELLRKGSPHNQLLSPLTDYIGITGTSGASSVTLPFDQSEFNHLIADLRYTDGDEDDQTPRQFALRSLGTALGDVFNQVPGLSGIMTDIRSSEKLIKLQFVSSALERSLLPIELSKMPSGSGRSTNEFLALSASARICITRRMRSVESVNGSCFF